MGNIQIANSANKYKLDPPTSGGVYNHQQLSLPRIPPQPQGKLLLPAVDRDQLPKLRSTENGKILNSGGTLSGRHQEGRGVKPLGVCLNVRERADLAKGSRDRKQRPALKKFGSEPDLRHRERLEGAAREQRNLVKRRRDAQQSGDDCDRISSAKRVGLYKKSENGKINFFISKQRTDDVIRLQAASKPSTLDCVAPPIEPQPILLEDKPTTNDDPDPDPNEDLNKSAVKKYYFGMDRDDVTVRDDSLDYDIEAYVRSSDLSDELLSNLSNAAGDEITLNLRPILPKKRPEIPRFSSSLAWKLLYSAECADSSVANDEDRYSAEERIAPKAELKSDFHFNQDKSGDSGISGDETPKPAIPWSNWYKGKQSWTPQEDLEDSSSDDADEERKFHSVPYYGHDNRPHVFSLSLPRDHFTNQYGHLQRYRDRPKRSASGVFAASDDDELDCAEVTDDSRVAKSSNWLLSKSAPNSLEYVRLDEGTARNHGKGRIIYLPNPPEAETTKGELLAEEAERRERRRLREIEAMRKIEEEFRKKRAKHGNVYSRQDFQKPLICPGEKSV